MEFGWRTIDSDATAHGGQRRPAGSGRSRGLSRGGLGPAEVRPRRRRDHVRCAAQATAHRAGGDPREPRLSLGGERSGISTRAINDLERGVNRSVWRDATRLLAYRVAAIGFGAAGLRTSRDGTPGYLGPHRSGAQLPLPATRWPGDGWRGKTALLAWLERLCGEHGMRMARVSGRHLLEQPVGWRSRTVTVVTARALPPWWMSPRCGSACVKGLRAGNQAAVKGSKDPGAGWGWAIGLPQAAGRSR